MASAGPLRQGSPTAAARTQLVVERPTHLYPLGQVKLSPQGKVAESVWGVSTSTSGAVEASTTEASTAEASTEGASTARASTARASTGEAVRELSAGASEAEPHADRVETMNPRLTAARERARGRPTRKALCMAVEWLVPVGSVTKKCGSRMFAPPVARSAAYGGTSPSR